MGLLKIKYQSYILSPEWEHKKKYTRRLYEQLHYPIECVRCFSVYKIQLHHNYYPTELDDANLSDLDWICVDCHQLWHSRYPGVFQNKATLINLAFYDELHDSKDLLRKKIQIDEISVAHFFLQPEVILYAEAEENVNKFQTIGIVASFFLFFFYGVGIITFFATFIIFQNRQIKPAKYDSYVEKKKSLILKKEWLEKSEKEYIENYCQFNY